MDSVNFISDQYHTISKQKTDESEKLKQIDDSVTKMSPVNEELRKGLKYLKYSKSELKEDLLDLKSHTIRDNLVFTNIPERYNTTDERRFEDTEMVITDFFRRKLNNLNNVGIERVHRKKPNRSTRSPTWQACTDCV